MDSAKKFANYLAAAPKPVADAVVCIVDTAKDLKEGAVDNGMEITDALAFEIATQITLNLDL